MHLSRARASNRVTSPEETGLTGPGGNSFEVLRRPSAQGYAGSVTPLAQFSPAVRSWFEQTFDAPTPAQALGWPAIASGAHTLIQAPTGSGKTLAAFL